jgi:hypothetical protein
MSGDKLAHLGAPVCEFDRLKAQKAVLEQAILDRTVNQAAVAMNQRGTTFFTTKETLEHTVERAQVHFMAKLVRSRMSSQTFRAVAPTGALAHLCVLDDFMSPLLVELLLIDDSRVYIQVMA